MIEIPPTRYAPTPDGGFIAYKAIGSGPIDLAYVGTIASQVEVMWEYEPCARFWLDLASTTRLILHDRRGTGLSDAGKGLPNLETRASDLLAVLDHAGATRPNLLGTVDGGMVCALLAATHPDRVASFVWLLASARNLQAPDWPFGGPPEEVERFASSIGAGWGTEAFVSDLWGPGIADRTDGLPSWLAKMQRAFCGPASAVDFVRLWHEEDVRDVLPTLRVRTRLVEPEDPPPDLLGAGAATAAMIRGAELVSVPAAAPYFLWDDGKHWLAAIRDFIGAAPPPAEVDRVLATVLFTDIVGSTQRAAELGDARWKDLLAEHDRVAKEHLDRFRGRFVHTTGDGLLATFDGPARAIRCAQAIADGVRPLGLEIRSGCHTGEVELSGEDVQGVSVHVGARVAALAGPSEVLVSSTVKDLTPGSGLAFEDAGEHELKGVPDRWRLYRVVS